MVRIEAFNRWLSSRGAKCSRVHVRYYGPDFRGVHTRGYIPEGEEVLSIPKSLIITAQSGKDTEIGKKLVKSGIPLNWDYLVYITIFLLTEMHKKDSSWKPYLDVYPKLVSSFPLFFPEKVLTLLKGTSMGDYVSAELEQIKDEYEKISEAVPEFAQGFSFDEYARNKVLVISRIFDAKFCGVMQKIMVPMAGIVLSSSVEDMFNFDYDKVGQTRWAYSEQEQAFVITSLRGIPKGESVSNLLVID